MFHLPPRLCLTKQCSMFNVPYSLCPPKLSIFNEAEPEIDGEGGIE
jgi:hypothetical protein